MGALSTLVVVGSALATVAAAGVARYCWARRDAVPGVGILAATNVAAACWSGTYLGTLLAGDAGATFLWFRLTFVAGPVATVLLLLFVARYTDRDWLVRPRYALALSAAPVATLVGMATNATPPFGGLHTLWWRDAATVAVGGLLVPDPSPGPLLWAYKAYVSLVALVAFGLLGE